MENMAQISIQLLYPRVYCMNRWGEITPLCLLASAPPRVVEWNVMRNRDEWIFYKALKWKCAQYPSSAPNLNIQSNKATTFSNYGDIDAPLTHSSEEKVSTNMGSSQLTNLWKVLVSCRSCKSFLLFEKRLVREKKPSIKNIKTPTLSFAG